MKINLLHTGCLEYMRTLPDNAFDLAIVDPPTGQGEGKKHTTRGKEVKQKNGGILRVKTIHSVKEWDASAPTQEYYDELFRVTKHQIIMCENYLHFEQKKNSPGRIIWNLLRENDFSACQIMWTSLTNKIEYFEYMWNGMLQGEAINSRKQIGDKSQNQSRIHPSEKPVKVYKYLLKTYAKEGWKIFDTHGGSNAIALAAYDLDFELTTCESDFDYWQKGVERFNIYQQQLKLAI